MSEIGAAERIDFRRVVLYGKHGCELSLMWRLSALRWNKVSRMSGVFDLTPMRAKVKI